MHPFDGPASPTGFTPTDALVVVDLQRDFADPDGIRAVDLAEGDGERTIALLVAAGARTAVSAAFLEEPS